MSAPATQLALAGIEAGWELLTVEEDRKAGRFTAALLDKNAAKRDAVIEALAQGMAIRSIAGAYEISVNTVLTAKRIYGEKIETEKQRLGRDCFDVARLAVERIRDEIQFMPRASLPIVAGIMAEKGLLLTGAPTARVEHIGLPTVASIADYINSLPAATPVGTRENSEQKAVVLELPATGLVPACDSRSLDSCPSSERSKETSAESGQIEPQKGNAP